MATRRRGVKNVLRSRRRRRHTKTSRHKQNYRNKKVTRKISSSSQHGGGKSVRPFLSSLAKTRWGVRLQYLVTENEVHPNVLDAVLRLPPTEQHDIPARFARRNQPPGAINPNISIKIKKVKKSDYKGKPFHQTGSRNIETGDALRFASAILDDPEPYEMILVDYNVTNSHATPYRQLRLNLKSLSSYIFGKLTPDEKADFLRDIRTASEYIKQGRIKEGKAIVDQKNALLKRKGSTFRLAPKISSKIDESAGLTTGQKRLQGAWKLKSTDPFLLKYATEESPPSSGESDKGVDPNAWRYGSAQSWGHGSTQPWGHGAVAVAGPAPSSRKPKPKPKYAGPQAGLLPIISEEHTPAGNSASLYQPERPLSFFNSATNFFGRMDPNPGGDTESDDDGM
jgi:hypothetical protein